LQITHKRNEEEKEQEKEEALSTSRQLLNTEKLYFESGTNGHVKLAIDDVASDVEQSFVNVTAVYTGHSWVEGRHLRPVYFNICAEALLFKDMPYEVLKIGALLVTLFVIVVIVYRLAAQRRSNQLKEK
jgi:hypothetical protein